MKSLVSALVLVTLTNAAAEPCTPDERQVGTNCHWERNCTYDDVTGDDKVCSASGDPIPCAVETVATDCADASFRCLANGDGVLACQECSDQSECSTATSPVNSQCVTTGTGLVDFCSDGTCDVLYETTYCQPDYYCYVAGDATVGSCTPNCVTSADCQALTGDSTLVCNTEDLGQTPDLINKCIPKCSGNSCVTEYGDGFLCAEQDVELWDRDPIPDAFRTVEAGTCYEGQCTLDSDTYCQFGQTCNWVLEACWNLGSCTSGSTSSCLYPGLFCASNGDCTMCDQTEYICNTAQECMSATTGECIGLTCNTADTQSLSACSASQSVCVPDATDSATGNCTLCDTDTACPDSYTCVLASSPNTLEQNVCMLDQCDFVSHGDNGCENYSYEACTENNQCETRACASVDDGCTTGICTIASECAPCSDTEVCDGGFHCDAGICNLDCTDNAGCESWQECSIADGVCEGVSCDSALNTFNGNPSCPGATGGTFAMCDTGSQLCTDCSITISGMMCGTDTSGNEYFCSTGSASQAAYVTGTCYASQCGTDGLCTTDQNQDCTNNQGICTEIPCTLEDAATTCATKSCAMNGDSVMVCSDCVDESSTTTCASGYSCLSGNAVCQAGACTAQNQATNCAITEECDYNLTCQTMTCSESSDCCRANDDETDFCTGTSLCDDGLNECVSCTTSTGTGAQSCETGNDASYVCNSTADSPYIGQCALEQCTTVGGCPFYTEYCDITSSQCRLSSGCVADPTLCRAVGTDAYGVCDSSTDICIACSQTDTDGVISSDCPVATTYCNMGTEDTTGNFCDTAACLTEACPAWQTCDSTGTGACQDITCAIVSQTTDCPTGVCDEDTLKCTGCSIVEGSQDPVSTNCQTGQICDASTSSCSGCTAEAASTCYTGVCDTATALCVGCTNNAEGSQDPAVTGCSSGQLCNSSSICVSCSADVASDCPSGVCDTTTLLCTGCTYIAEGSQDPAVTGCSTGQLCSATQVCTGCVVESATACPSSVCDATTSLCVGCAYDADKDMDDSEITGCPASDSEADTYYECDASTNCVKLADEGLSGGAIAGIIIGSVVGVALIIAAIFFLTKKDPATEGALLLAHTDC